MKMSFNLGIIAYSTNTGLGVQSYGYYKYLRPAKTLVVDLSEFNNMPQHPEWYPDGIFCKGFPTIQVIDEFLNGLTHVLMAETPLNQYLVLEATRRGIKTIIQPNYEFCDWLINPGLPIPSVFALPSLWNLPKYKDLPVAHLPVPVDGEVLEQRTIKQAKRFFHIAGRVAVHDRNGTLDFIAAARLAKTPEPDLEFRIYLQGHNAAIERSAAAAGVEIVRDTTEYSDLYSWGDIMVLPRRYGGLCLPAQEAVYCGIPTLMPNVDPNNRWMPEAWMLRVKMHKGEFISRTKITIHSVDIASLAQRMLDISRRPSWVQEQNIKALQMAEQLDWRNNVGRYRTFMEHVH